MQEKYSKFQYTARYFQLGELNANCKRVIFVIHGYGQQAKYFLKKFTSLADGETCIIAPEGLSRFYLEGFSGRVGATWMTKEDRLTDIDNYLSYLNSLYTSLKKAIPNEAEIVLLGFSQGSATVSRWASSGVVTFNKLILWAGVFPPDMNFESSAAIFANKEIHYVYGSEDPYVNQERLDEMKVLSDKLDVQPRVTTFSGEHNIDAEVLAQLLINDS